MSYELRAPSDELQFRVSRFEYESSIHISPSILILRTKATASDAIS